MPFTRFNVFETKLFYKTILENILDVFKNHLITFFIFKKEYYIFGER